MAVAEVTTMQSRGIARGKIIELEEVLPYAEGCLVNVIVEPENSSLQAGSPAAILRALHEPPHLTDEVIDELEQAIAAAQLPVHNEGVFDDKR